MQAKKKRIINLGKLEHILEQAISTRNWAAVNKSKLPAPCFLWVPDPMRRNTWKLPYREGTGRISEKTGMYKKAGPVNLNAIRAIMSALVDNSKGKPISVPVSIRKRVEAIAENHNLGRYNEKFFFGGLVISEAFKSLRQSLDVAVAKAFGKKSYVSDFSNREVIVGFYGDGDEIDVDPDARIYQKVQYKINKGNIEFTGKPEDVARVISYESAELTAGEFSELLGVDAGLRRK